MHLCITFPSVLSIPSLSTPTSTILIHASAGKGDVLHPAPALVQGMAIGMVVVAAYIALGARVLLPHGATSPSLLPLGTKSSSILLEQHPWSRQRGATGTALELNRE